MSLLHTVYVQNVVSGTELMLNKQSLDGWIDRWMYVWMDSWTDGCTQLKNKRRGRG